MKLNLESKLSLLMLLLLTSLNLHASTFTNDEPPVAIFDFREKGDGFLLQGSGEKISTMLYAFLSSEPGIVLVDREELDRIEDEVLLNMSGMVNQNQAIQVGQLTGAKILVTGTVFEVDGNMMVVAKLIGVETSRVIGVTTNSNFKNEMVGLVQELSNKIVSTIDRKSSELIAPQFSQRDRMAELATQLSSKHKPSISVDVAESHISRRTTPDPAAETELIQYLISAGFDVIEATSESAESADLTLTGEGFTEFATRKGDLVGVRARVEIKVVDNKTDRVIAVDRQTEIELNLSEVLAGKNALQRAAAQIAERLLPQLASAEEE